MKITIPICDITLTYGLIIFGCGLLVFANYFLILEALERPEIWVAVAVVLFMTFMIFNLTIGIFTGKLPVEFQWRCDKK